MPFFKEGQLTKVHKGSAFALCGSGSDAVMVYIPATADLFNRIAFAGFSAGETVIMLCENQEERNDCMLLAVSVILQKHLKVVVGEVANPKPLTTHVMVSAKELNGQRGMMTVFMPRSAVKYFLNGPLRLRDVEYKNDLEAGDRITIGVMPQPNVKNIFWVAVKVLDLPKLRHSNEVCRSGDSDFSSTSSVEYECESEYSTPEANSVIDLSPLRRSSTGQSQSVPACHNDLTTKSSPEYADEFPRLPGSVDTPDIPNAHTTDASTAPLLPPKSTHVINGLPPGLPQVSSENQNSPVNHSNGPVFHMHQKQRRTMVNPNQPCKVGDGDQSHAMVNNENNQNVANLPDQDVPQPESVNSCSPVTSSQKSPSPIVEERETLQPVNNDNLVSETKPKSSVEKRMLAWVTKDPVCLTRLMDAKRGNPALFEEWCEWAKSQIDFD